MAPQPVTPPLGYASTNVSITNCTGNPINLVSTHDWIGYFFRSPTSPIPDGSIGYFLHVSGFKALGSQGAVVYRVNDDKGQGICDVLIAWSVMPDPITEQEPFHYKNQVLTLVLKVGSPINWVEILRQLKSSGSTSEGSGYGIKSDVNIKENIRTAELEAVINVDPTKLA